MKLRISNKKIIKGNEEGFAILEGLIAAAIFSLAMSAVVSLMVGTMKTNAIARDMSEAASLGADVIERISALPYDDLNLQNNSYTESDYDKYSFAIATQLNDIIDNTMTITVTVSWQDRGQTRQVIINDTKVDFI